MLIDLNIPDKVEMQDDDWRRVLGELREWYDAYKRYESLKDLYFSENHGAD